MYHILLVGFVLLLLLLLCAAVLAVTALTVYVLKSGQVVPLYVWLDGKLNGYPAWVWVKRGDDRPEGREGGGKRERENVLQACWEAVSRDVPLEHIIQSSG